MQSLHFGLELKGVRDVLPRATPAVTEGGARCCDSRGRGFENLNQFAMNIGLLPLHDTHPDQVSRSGEGDKNDFSCGESTHTCASTGQVVDPHFNLHKEVRI
jgi:hypothetical protein